MFHLENTSYHSFFTKIPEPANASEESEVDIDDCQKQHLSQRYSIAFLSQFNYGVFYAYLKLKEIEIKNIFKLATIF